MNQLLRTNLSGGSLRLKQSGPWENLSAYHKLTFDSGTQMLEDKWNQYIGNDSCQIIDKPSFVFSKKLQKSSTSNLNPNGGYVNTVGLVKNNSSSSLPAGTQQRLNQHREWLKKFKANTDFKNSSIFF